MFGRGWRARHDRLVDNLRRCTVTVVADGQNLIGPINLFDAMCCIKYGGYGTAGTTEHLGEGILYTIAYDERGR